MNKKIILTTALWATSVTFAAGTFETWNGADYLNFDTGAPVKTGLGIDETSHVWYSYGDDANGGASTIYWPVEMDWPYISFEAVAGACNGICGKAILNQGILTTKPFVGLGFLVVGTDSPTSTTPLAGDVSSWGGLCVTYVSDIDMRLELGLGSKVDSTISFANPAVTLPAEKSQGAKRPYTNIGKKVVVSWSDFKQPSWHDGSVKFDGETAAKQLVAVKFVLQEEPGEYNFNICAVGPKDGTCPEKCGMPTPPEAIKVARGTSAVKTILKDRMLSFAGVSHATAEVMNSLGQVVAHGAIKSDVTTLNLAHLDAGMYMVRVSGKSANFTKKIVLK